MVSRRAAAVLQGVGCENGFVITKRISGKGMYLANDHNYLQQLRLEQRKKMASSELLDHAGFLQPGASISQLGTMAQEQGWASETKKKSGLIQRDRSKKQRLLL